MQFGNILRKNPVLWLTLLYVLWQLSLSGAILSAATEEQSRFLSDLARITVGLGAGLWIVRLGVAKRCRPVLIGMLALVLGWGAMQLEDAIVNACADRTTGEERRDAGLILMFNDALLKGKAQLTTLPPGIAESPVRYRVFAKVLGFAVWQDSELLQEVRKAVDGLFEGNARVAIQQEVDKQYAEYVKEHNRHSQSYVDAVARLKRAPYNDMVAKLNDGGILSQYELCPSASCRQKLQEQVNAYLRKQGFNLSISLESFCRRETEHRYMPGGRQVSAGTRLRCPNTTDAKVYEIAMQALKDRVAADLRASGREGISVDDALKMAASKPLTREEWREKAAPKARERLEAEREKRFPPASEYAPGGALADKGRDLCISVFLPPVALGFSLAVCFLHLLTTFCMLIPGQTLRGVRNAAVSAVCAALLLLPAWCATPVPLEGFAGVYARWLVFWEAWLVYPVGLLRPLILGCS